VRIMSVDSLREVRDTINELLHLHQLNLELLETLENILFWLQDFEKKSGMSIPNREKLASLIGRTDDLLDEIATPSSSIYGIRFSRRKVTDFRTDGEVTESSLRHS